MAKKKRDKLGFIDWFMIHSSWPHTIYYRKTGKNPYAHKSKSVAHQLTVEEAGNLQDLAGNCPNCGKRIEKILETKYCQYCGTKLNIQLQVNNDN